jgi:hypothetical protein
MGLHWCKKKDDLVNLMIPILSKVLNNTLPSRQQLHVLNEIKFDANICEKMLSLNMIGQTEDLLNVKCAGAQFNFYIKLNDIKR